MTSTIDRKVCVDCKEQTAVFQCQGCTQYYCWSHTTSHHTKLLQDFEQIGSTFSQVEKVFDEHQFFQLDGIDQLYNEFNLKIDQWEQNSIDKIRHVAEENRIELKRLTKTRWTNLKSQLNRIDDELKSTRKQNNVLETDIKRWRNQLIALQKNLITKPNLVLKTRSKTSIDEIHLFDLNVSECFERGTNNACFEEENRLVSIGNGSDLYTEVRGMKQYQTGEHFVRLHVEKVTGWFLIGIINAFESLQTDSYISPSCYGWYNGHGFVYRAGQNSDENGHDLIENDVAQLIINCDQRFIRLINERTNKQLELQVDLQSCPFPWQLHLNLNMKPSRIRIVSSSI